MKKNLLILIISALLIFFISIFRLSKELNEKKYEIEELNGNIDELTSELEDLKNQKISNSDYESDISKIYEMKIALLEEENKFLENTVNKLRMSSSAVVNNSSIGGMAGNKSSTNPGSAPNTVRKTASPII